MTGRVRDKVILVTGGAGGVGTAIARKFAEQGAMVVMSDLDARHGALALAALADDGMRARFVEHDVTDEASWEDVLSGVMATERRLDVLINNAGVGARVGQPFEAIELDEWRRVLRVNLEGAFLGTRAGVRAMKESGGGAIINIGSVAGVVGTRGGAAYGASKGGVHALTRQAAFSCGRNGYGIRVNSILPSYVWTDLVADKAISEFGTKEKAMAAFAERNLLGRVNEPEDIAWAALFLGSDESRQINGIELVIDGGQLIT